MSNISKLPSDIMYNKKVRTYEPVFLLFAIIGLLLSSCAEESPPARNFSTSQLLISPLPGWGIYSGPEDMQPRYFNLYGAVAGSAVRLMKPPAGIKQWSRDDVDNQLWEPIVEINQWVVKFSTIRHAKQAYSDRYMVLNGRNTPLYIPLEGFDYKSRIADQFRLLCNSSLPPKGGTDCFLDAQYQEYYVMVQYSSANPDNIQNTIGDLKTIAIAVDAQMEKFLDVPNKQ